MPSRILNCILVSLPHLFLPLLRERERETEQGEGRTRPNEPTKSQGIALPDFFLLLFVFAGETHHRAKLDSSHFDSHSYVCHQFRVPCRNRRTTNKIREKEKRTRKNQSHSQTSIVVGLLFGCGGFGMFISRVGIITLSFALGSAWGRLFFAPVSVGNMIKGKKKLS